MKEKRLMKELARGLGVTSKEGIRTFREGRGGITGPVMRLAATGSGNPTIQELRTEHRRLAEGLEAIKLRERRAAGSPAPAVKPMTDEEYRESMKDVAGVLGFGKDKKHGRDCFIEGRSAFDVGYVSTIEPPEAA